ncbi:hypothetical protein [Pseudonocardia pini]|uniref:hypothetical protein n=1 Tax=Pseudonocardia pini TaxID=2758030 RepID=UPI0015F0C9DC|nr:hypothetical protein [Pseudonocardia pini]
MGSFNLLRDEIVHLMESGPGWTRNRLYAEIERRTDGNPPISRATFFRWFGSPPRDATAELLACVPVLAQILDTREHVLYHLAGILPVELEASMTLASAARDFRIASRAASRALSQVGLSTAGEALIVDRILHHKLDYRITVWPVVRGTSNPLHLRSWVAIQPVEPMIGRQRPRTAAIERRPVRDRREHFRYEVITDGLWRSLGLRWRDPLPIEWPYPNDPPDLLVEMAVEERDRDRPDPRRATFDPARILVLSAVWGHVEPLVSTLADALQWGSYDLRNQGFSFLDEDTEKIQFCRETLAEAAPHYVWAIAEPASVTRALRKEIEAAADTHRIVWVSYGELFARTAARAFRLRPAAVAASRRAVRDVVARLNTRHEILHVHYADDDLRFEDRGKESLDRNLLVDHVRYTAGEILNHLHDHGGPPITAWGPRFDDLRRGSNRYAHVPPRGTTVRLLERGSVR